MCGPNRRREQSRRWFRILETDCCGRFEAITKVTRSKPQHGVRRRERFNAIPRVKHAESNPNGPFFQRHIDFGSQIRRPTAAASSAGGVRSILFPVDTTRIIKGPYPIIGAKALRLWESRGDEHLSRRRVIGGDRQDATQRCSIVPNTKNLSAYVSMEKPERLWKGEGGQNRLKALTLDPSESTRLFFGSSQAWGSPSGAAKEHQRAFMLAAASLGQEKSPLGSTMISDKPEISPAHRCPGVAVVRPNQDTTPTGRGIRRIPIRCRPL